jgi:hypothetical protein
MLTRPSGRWLLHELYVMSQTARRQAVSAKNAGMIWSARPFYAVAMLLAALPPLLATRMERAPLAPAAINNRMGLTLGEDDGHRIVVTSLRSGGMADRNGIRVGDQLIRIADRPVVGLAIVRNQFHAPDHCATALTFRRDGISSRSIIWQCRAVGVR